MAASMKEIKLRIHSVESTMQITRAMELVAFSKLRKAQELMNKSRPYAEALYKTLSEISSGDAELSSPYIGEKPGRTCWIVIAGDRGLAGGYNSNVLKLAAQKMASQEDPVVVPIGKKAVEFFRRRKIPMLTTEYAEAGDLSVSDCFTMARTLCRQYCAGEFAKIELVFTSFVSVLQQNPSSLQLLPLFVDHTEKPRKKVIAYDPDDETVYNAIVPEYVGGMIYGALCESVASELGARRTAMDAATKNAGEMIDDLNLKYNRSRQSAITQEITEIVSGAQDE